MVAAITGRQDRSVYQSICHGFPRRPGVGTYRLSSLAWFPKHVIVVMFYKS